MAFDWVWVLLGLPTVFALGWAASRFDMRQLRAENRRAPKAYFRGLNFLLNEQQDQAIDAFVEAVQSDPDTSELHFALGNLFRKRGDYERAVRVHTHLLSRGDLSAAERDRAQNALAQDYLKAGLLDRAEAALKRLEGTAYARDSQLALLSIYERSRDWTAALQIAQQLQGASSLSPASGQGGAGVPQSAVTTAATNTASVTALATTASITPAPLTTAGAIKAGGASVGSMLPRMAHYLCEQADGMTGEGAASRALEQLERAHALCPQAARPMIALAQRHIALGDMALALGWLIKASEQAPRCLPLIASDMARCALASDQTDAVRARLRTAYNASPSLDLMQAFVTLDGDTAQARDAFVAHLEHTPSLVAATRWMAHERLEHEQFHPQVQKALDKAVKPLERYRCAACAFEATRHFWQCPGCQGWDTYPARRVEEL